MLPINTLIKYSGEGTAGSAVGAAACPALQSGSPNAQLEGCAAGEAVGNVCLVGQKSLAI